MRRMVLMAIITGIAVSASATLVGAQERYYARAVNMGSIGAGLATTMQIQIDRWTTDAERIALLGVVTQHANEKRGQEELVKALQAQKDAGNVQIHGAAAQSTGFPSVRLRYARAFPKEDGKVLVLVTDRPIGLGEAMGAGGSWTNYPISVIILDLDEEGKGSGTMNIGVQVLMDEETGGIKLGRYTSEPVRLTKVAPRK